MPQIDGYMPQIDGYKPKIDRYMLEIGGYMPKKSTVQFLRRCRRRSLDLEGLYGPMDPMGPMLARQLVSWIWLNFG